MLISLNKEGLIQLASLTPYNTDKLSCVSFEIGGIRIKYGQVDLLMSLNCDAGDAILNITQASIAGLSLFGIVKTKARELITGAIKPYIQCTVITDGKIRLTKDGLYFSSIVTDTDVITLLVESPAHYHLA